MSTPATTAATAERQRVVCVWCKWEGPSPVKKILRKAGTDYPIQCRQCNAIGLKPIDAE